MTNAAYAPGAAVGIVGPGVAVLMDLPAAHPLVTAVFDCLQATPTLEAVLEVLVADGLRDLHSFAAGALSADGARAVVRGGYRAAVAGLPEPVVGSGVWADRSVPGASSIVLSVDGGAASGLPIGSGVVLASAIVLGGVTRSPVAAPPLDPGIFRGGPEPTGPAVEAAAEALGGGPAAAAVPAPVVPPEVGAGEASFWARPGPGGEGDPEADVPDQPRGVSAPAAPASGEVLVRAVRCPAGHLGPVGSDACRVCHRPVLPQEPVEVIRPRLGVLRLSNGEDLALDGSVVLGRHPRVPAGMDGDRVTLVTLHDPGKDISSQHLAVTLEDWRVLVTDLGSTNGTTVVLPGRHPVRLRPYEPLPLEPGTRLHLAGVLDFTFEIG